MGWLIVFRVPAAHCEVGHWPFFFWQSGHGHRERTKLRHAEPRIHSRKTKPVHGHLFSHLQARNYDVDVWPMLYSYKYMVELNTQGWG